MKKHVFPLLLVTVLILSLLSGTAYALPVEDFEPEETDMVFVLEEIIEGEEQEETIAAAELPQEDLAVTDPEEAEQITIEEPLTEEQIVPEPETVPIIEEQIEGVEEEQTDVDPVLFLLTGKGDPAGTLSRGSRGNDVLELQQLLYEKGYLAAEPDGVFGAYTERAVRKYQMYNNLNITGVADADTREQVSGQEEDDFYSLQKGSRGNAVYQLQIALQEQGYLTMSADGSFGAYTDQAVRDFQEANNLTVDGIAGPLTMEALFRNYTPATAASSTDTAADASQLSKGMNGEAVRNLQKQLYSAGFLTVQPDGIFGNKTENAIKSFQLFNGLAVTGTADSSTRDLIASGDSISYTSLSRGSTGTAVTNIQIALRKLGYLDSDADGIFGRLTYNAVLNYQKDNDLTADGIFGRYTTAAMTADPAMRTAAGTTDKQTDKQQGSDVSAVVQDVNALKKGMSGAEVLKLQEALIRNGFLNVEADGIFGAKTEKALKSFEVYNNLPVTGIADSSLQSVLYSDKAVPFSVLSLGSRGVSVLGIQKVLYNLGFLDAQPDGIFGQYTKAALTSFQEFNDVGSSYGIADWSTAEELTDLTDKYETEMTGINDQQRALIQTAYMVPTTAAGLCAGWVGNVLSAYGISGSTVVSSRDSVYSYAYLNGLTDDAYAYDTDFNANDFWAYVCTSDDRADLKPGMVVATRSTYSYLGRQFGHVGFYIGNDKVISSIGYIEVIDIDDFDEKYNNKEYGSTIRWGFAPSMTGN